MAGGNNQRGAPDLRLRVYIRSGGDQHLHLGRLQCGVDEGRNVESVPGIDTGARVEKYFDGVHASDSGGVHQGSGAARICDIRRGLRTRHRFQIVKLVLADGLIPLAAGRLGGDETAGKEREKTERTHVTQKVTLLCWSGVYTLDKQK